MGTVEFTEGAPSGEPDRSDASLERRAARRQKRKREHTEQCNWELTSLLASVSAEVEDIATEARAAHAALLLLRTRQPPTTQAARLRYMWTTPVVLATDVELSEGQKQQLVTEHQQRMRDILHKGCGGALKLIMQHKWAFPFNAPVDTNKYKDYLSYVSQPMDLGTIKTRLESSSYTHPDQILADVKLVFANTRKYNPASSDVVTMANALESKFEERWTTTVVPKVGDEKINVANAEMLAKKRILEGQQQQILVQLERQRQLLLQRLHALVTRVADAKSQAAAACAPLTPEEKSAVTRQLAVLPQEHFETALSLVLAHHPDLLPQGSSGETVLNADHMDALTLRQLQSFITAVHAAERQLGAMEEGPAGGAVQWPGLVMGSGRRPMRRQRDGGGRGPHSTSNGSVHRSGAAGDAAGEGAETSEGGIASGEAAPAAPGSPTAPASSFAGQQEGVHAQSGVVSSPVNNEGDV